MAGTCRQHGALAEQIKTLIARFDDFEERQMEKIHERISRKDVERQQAEQRLEEKIDGVSAQVGELKEYVHKVIQRSLTWLLVFIGGGIVTWAITQLVRLVMSHGVTP